MPTFRTLWVPFVSEWQQWDDSYSCLFDGTRRVVDDWTVEICGVQFCDGRIEWSIRARSNEKFSNDDMPAAVAPRVAAALVEAADEIERLSGGQPS